MTRHDISAGSFTVVHNAGITFCNATTRKYSGRYSKHPCHQPSTTAWPPGDPLDFVKMTSSRTDTRLLLIGGEPASSKVATRNRRHADQQIIAYIDDYKLLLIAESGGLPSRPAQPVTNLARGSKDKEHAMSQSLNNPVALIGIDIVKNSFHVVGLDDRGQARRYIGQPWFSLPTRPLLTPCNSASSKSEAAASMF